MTQWFTADLHLGHTRICELAGRPYETVEEMDDDLIGRWNSLVQPADAVLVVGDLAMGRLDDSLARCRELAGTVILMPGNHDRPWAHYDSRYAAQPERLVTATARYADVGVSVLAADMGLLNHPRAYACHFPYEGDSGYEERYEQFRPPRNATLPWLIHGHVHEQWRQSGHQINVGVDAWGGFPVDADTLAAMIDDGPRDLEPLEWER